LAAAGVDGGLTLHSVDSDMNPNSILFGETNTLRSGWRVAVYLLATVLAGGGVAVLVVGLFETLYPGGPGIALMAGVQGLTMSAVALAIGWLCATFFEKLPFRSLGAAFTRGWLTHFIVGILVGGITFAVAALVGMASGGLRFRLNTDAGIPTIAMTVAVSFLIFAAAAAFEEALLRGYMLQTFIRSDLTLFAVLLTSMIFATLHNANPGSTWLSWLNTFLAGIWLAVAYLKTRDLWFPLGIHLSWNWVMGSVFGIEVSGLTDIIQAPLMREADTGPTWLTGGDYGLEGGVICTVALLVSTVAIHFLPYIRPDEEVLAMTSPNYQPLADRTG